MKVLGISAGNGVNLFPFKEYVIGNVEVRADYTIRGDSSQFHLNFPKAYFKKALGPYEEPDIIIGNPKCGSSSVLALSRAKQFKTHKGEPSLDLFIGGIHFYQPKVFLLENLPGLLNTYSQQHLQELFPNYLLNFWVGSMFTLGNSQFNRKRLIITGVRKTRSLRASRLWAALRTPYRVHEPKFTQELLRDLPDNGNFRPDLNTRIAIYGGRQMTYAEIKDMWEALGPVTRIHTPDETFKTAPGVYRDLPTRFPNTIRKSNRCFNPDGLSYTPRERARIQGIPDDFLILSSGKEPTTLFNKGCITTGSTPSYEVGLWFYNTIKPFFKDL